MGKRVSKIAAVVIAALVMLANMSVLAFANESIAPEKGTLTIHKYLMNDASLATNHDGTNLEWDDGNLPEGLEPLGGITFHLYRVVLPTAGANAGKVPAAGAYSMTKSEAGVVLAITDADGVTFDVTPVTTLITDAGGVAASGELAQGIYFVEEEEIGSVASPVAPFVVAVPMTNAAGTAWITDVHVYPKNEDMSIAKEVSVDSVSVGGVTRYTLLPTVPSGIEKAKVYKITDPLHAALDYQEDSVVVRAAKTASGLDNSGGTVVDAKYYTVTHADGTLTVEFNKDGRAYLGGENGFKFLSIVFDVKVNSAILNSENYTVANQAFLDYTNQYDQDKDRESGKVNIHTGLIEVLKVDANNANKKLNGAVFRIASSEANALAGNYLKTDAMGNIYDVGDAGYEPPAENGGDEGEGETDIPVYMELKTGDDGLIVFKGLRDYTGSGDTFAYSSYWLVEITAPSGYNLLPNPVEVKFSDTSTANKYTAQITVQNSNRFLLPTTGGAGTILYTVGGIVLVGLAIILILTQGKKKNKVR